MFPLILHKNASLNSSENSCENRIVRCWLTLLRSRRRRRIRVDRLQAKLLRERFFLAVLGLEGLQIENQVPCLVRFNVVGKGWHRRTIETSHENLVQIPIRRAALGSSPLGKIEGRNGPAEVVG